MPEPELDEPGRSDLPPISYGDALTELESILIELEDDAVDVDVLAERVARAAELITLCRARIEGARMDVERIVTTLED